MNHTITIDPESGQTIVRSINTVPLENGGELPLTIGVIHPATAAGRKHLRYTINKTSIVINLKLGAIRLTGFRIDKIDDEIMVEWRFAELMKELTSIGIKTVEVAKIILALIEILAPGYYPASQPLDGKTVAC
jgi:hypothetical protein